MRFGEGEREKKMWVDIPGFTHSFMREQNPVPARPVRLAFQHGRAWKSAEVLW